MKPQVEQTLLEYESSGLDRLTAIKQAIKDGRLKRAQDGSLELMSVREQEQRSRLGV